MKIIKNALIWTMKEKNNFIGSILIDGKKIIDVGNIDISKYPNAQVIDAKGAFVMPGIIDPHCHVGMEESTVGWAGDDVNEITNPVTPEMRGIDGIKAMDEGFKTALEGGVTTVCTGPGSANVIGGTFCALKTYGKTIEDMIIKEELAMKMALGENPKRCYGKDRLAPQTRMASAAIMREALTKARLYKKSMDDYSEEVKTNKQAKKPEYNAKWASLSRVFEGLPVKIHAHQSDDIVTALRISKEFNLTSTIEHCTDGYLIPEVLKKYGNMVIIGPTLGEKTKIELRNKSFNSAKVLYDEGITFSIMTDHPVTSLAYTRTQAGIFVNHGLPYIEALRSITINAAKCVFLDNFLGAIQKGYDADIVIYSEDPLVYTSKVLMVLVDGEIRVNNL